MKSDQFFSGDQYFSPPNNFTRLKLTLTKNIYQLFFLLNKNQITEILKKNQIYYTIIWLSGVDWWRVVKKGKFKKKRKMIHVVASDVCWKNMFYNQTSLKWCSAFSTISFSTIFSYPQNWSVTLTVVMKKKKTSTLTLILMNQLTWPLINFLLIK